MHRLTHARFATLALLSAICFPLSAIGQGTKADYERARRLGKRFADKVARSGVEPQWLSDTKFWYRVDLGGGRREVMLIDAATGERRPAFDHARFAAALKNHLGDDAPAADRLTIHKLALDGQGRAAWVRVAGRGWLRWDEPAGLLTPVAAGDAAPEAAELKAWQPPRSPRSGDTARRVSPDKRWEVTLRDGRLALRDRRPTSDDDESAEKKVAAPRAKGGWFDSSVHWAPDSSAFVAWDVTPGDGRKIHLIESSPKDQFQGKLHTLNYAKPGDRIEQRFPRLFRVGGGEEVPVDRRLFDNPWSIRQLRWGKDASRFTFVYNQRGHQALRLVGVDAATGEAKAIIDEQSDTFIDYAGKQFLHYLDDAGEAVWMSERDGWNHLYLIDAVSGVVKRQLTRGPWAVRGVEFVDEQARTLVFRCGGIYGEQDPYYQHFCRVQLDTGEITRLTAGDGTHRITWSPDGAYLIDEYSRVDLPPVTELRRASDGALVCELERGDATALVEAGWRAPERFVAKGRDGKTDIYGVLYRPTTFDPAKKYPVVEEHYAGPHSAHCPKAFRPFHARAQGLAELGFLVVQLDGMGTSHRSKAFHDVCHKNLVDGGFPDRIAWLTALAEHEPAIDLTRVGIRGTSAGGQTGLAALLHHGDFYKVAVSNCGCHDNRVDKIWWNELWMGWPIGPHYAAQSNVTNAAKLRGDLLLIVGEMDRNVDPISTLQVVDALVKADKDFEMLYLPGAGHGAGSYARRRTWDFFVQKLHGLAPRRE
ncbi:MAG: prolyl oligopeptidase family serine peptidase [Planctomycetota bacterium]